MLSSLPSVNLGDRAPGNDPKPGPPCLSHRTFLGLKLTSLLQTNFLSSSETAPKSVISLEPPWTTFFQGETVTLTCYGFGFNLPQKTKWYWNSKIVEGIQGHTFKVHTSGVHQCQADSLHLSIPVNLHFSKGEAKRNKASDSISVQFSL